MTAGIRQAFGVGTQVEACNKKGYIKQLLSAKILITIT